MERWVNNIHQYIYIYIYKPNINTMYVKWSQEQCTRDNVSKIERKEKIQKILTTSLKNTPPISYTNLPPMSMTTFIPKLLPLFVTSDKGQVYQVDISSSLGKPLSSSSSASSLLEPTPFSSSDASGEEDEAIMKPPMVACRHAI